jgi:hypothetical protein
LSSEAERPGHATRCPSCGLALQVSMRGQGPEMTYDFSTWSRVCRFPLLGGPSVCLARSFEPALVVAPDADIPDVPAGRQLGYS